MNIYEQAAIDGCQRAGAKVSKSTYRPASKLEPAGVGVMFTLGAAEMRHAIPVLDGDWDGDVERAFFEFVTRKRHV